MSGVTTQGARVGQWSILIETVLITTIIIQPHTIQHTYMQLTVMISTYLVSLIPSHEQSDRVFSGALLPKELDVPCPPFLPLWRVSRRVKAKQLCPSREVVNIINTQFDECNITSRHELVAHILNTWSSFSSSVLISTGANLTTGSKCTSGLSITTSS